MGTANSTNPGQNFVGSTADVTSLTVEGTLTVSGNLNVAPGEPGIDTASAGTLLIADNTATSIEIGGPQIASDITVDPAGSSFQILGSVYLDKNNGIRIGTSSLGVDTTGAFVLNLGKSNATGVQVIPDLILGLAAGPAARIRSLQDNIPTIGSGGSGISAQSVLAGSTNLAGQIQATLTSVAPGVVIGVVTFDDNPLATAPLLVLCSLAAPTAGVAAPPVVGADTYTANGFTIRSYGPTTVTTATYVITYWCIFT